MIDKILLKSRCKGDYVEDCELLGWAESHTRICDSEAVWLGFTGSFWGIRIAFPNLREGVHLVGRDGLGVVRDELVEPFSTAGVVNVTINGKTCRGQKSLSVPQQWLVLKSCRSLFGAISRQYIFFWDFWKIQRKIFEEWAWTIFFLIEQKSDDFPSWRVALLTWTMCIISTWY